MLAARQGLDEAARLIKVFLGEMGLVLGARALHVIIGPGEAESGILQETAAGVLQAIEPRFASVEALQAGTEALELRLAELLEV